MSACTQDQDGRARIPDGSACALAQWSAASLHRRCPHRIDPTAAPTDCRTGWLNWFRLRQSLMAPSFDTSSNSIDFVDLHKFVTPSLPSFLIASHTAAASHFDNHPTNREQLEQVNDAICGPLPGPTTRTVSLHLHCWLRRTLMPTNPLMSASSCA